MAFLEDLRERVKSESQQVWERVQESSAYNQLKDRFQNLTPNRQKMLIGGIALVIFLLLMSIPLSFIFK